MNEQLPYKVTSAAKTYECFVQLPVAVILDNLRSVYNVGSFFRTGDAAGIEKIYCSGITAIPPHKGIKKTALGAEETVPWEQSRSSLDTVSSLRKRGYEIAAVETSIHAVDLFDWVPNFPVCLLFGNEKEGLPADLAAAADRHVRIPMLGMKHSLNVSTACGIVLYELMRKYRILFGPAITSPR